MDALESKAWLAGQRRISQNQNLILKPDSVLEYSCFHQFIGYLAANPDGRRFSENYPVSPLWGEISGVYEYSLDAALFEVVFAPGVEYLHGSGFGHTYLGGRMPDAGGRAPPWGEYNCAAMQFVWGAARCMNFVDEPDIDDFFDFAWYASNDPRQIPPDYACVPQSAQMAGAIRESYRGQGRDGLHGDEYQGFVLASENNPYIGDGTRYERDAVPTDLLMQMMLPGDCGESAAVPTGVTVDIPDQARYQEHFCSKPGCSFNGAACVR